MKITEKTLTEATILYLEGRLDTITAPQLEKHIEERLDGYRNLVLDMENLEYISSAGLRVLLALQKVMTKQGSLEIIHVNETNMEVFTMTGFADILTIVP